jgi:PTH1 family peptidyl-tRNA hydrolase
MALFQRKPQSGERASYYSIGQNTTVLLVGLGNVGKEYNLTRHNAGFIAIDEFVAKSDEMEDWVAKKDLKCLMSSGRMGEKRVIAIKPTTFMNLSGEAVQTVVNFYKIQPDKIVVLHDEIDIDFGQIRLRVGGSDAGHNGIKSVSKAIGEDYGRVRIGIGPKQPARMASEDFVLQKFKPEEQAQLPNMTKEVAAILTEYLYGTELPHDTRSFLV